MERLLFLLVILDKFFPLFVVEKEKILFLKVYYALKFETNLKIMIIKKYASKDKFCFFLNT